MTVKLWAVDRLHLRFDYHSESIHSLFSAFCSKFCLFLYFFTHETYPYSSVYKKMHEARIYIFFYLQADPVLSFDVLYVQIFI